MGKRRKETTQKFEILISGTFTGTLDEWTEYLCLAQNPDGSITLSSRSREILAEAARYRENGWLPATIRRKEVWGFDGDYVVGERLFPHDADAELTVSKDQPAIAAEWLIGRKWHLESQFGDAWARIRSLLCGPDPFDPVTPGDLNRIGRREVVIRCPGPAKPWIVSLELVFIESPDSDFSVYARTRDAAAAGTESPRLLGTTAGPLKWRRVLEFVRSSDLANLSGSVSQPVEIDGLEPWQSEVIVTAMFRLWTTRFLSSLSDKELRSLHARLGGFLSDESRRLVSLLARATRSKLLGRKSLAGVARLVNSPDPFDAEKLAGDCAAWEGDHHAELVLAQYGRTPAPREETFLALLHYARPRPLPARAALFEMWMRAESKPKGGSIPGTGMHMADELPVLHWLLRGQAGEVFRTLRQSQEKELEEFVSWLLGAARGHAEHFSGRYEYHSFNLYAYGRPRHAQWARLAHEVQDAAVDVGVPFPESLRLPPMPTIDAPIRAVSVISPVRISKRQLKRLSEAL